MATKFTAEIGIIGGTGVYDAGLFSDKREVKVYTPFGDPSDLITIGEYAGKKVAFIPRHGKGHRIPPHKINSRANIWALKEIGVKRIIAPTAVGSMRYDYKPGDIAVPDQFVDFTKGRESTFYDGGEVCHISVADPFCSELHDIVSHHGKKLKYDIHPKATYVCIEGPRFSTRAESHFFRDVMKADLIGMTIIPECPLAREVELCYVSIATITDYDAWTISSVTSKEVIELLNKNIEKIRKLIAELIPVISVKRLKCNCRNALKGAIL
ncbi:MAG: S-methyl-5'-thioadenosine phosphorylase [Nitrososphaeraceae archaeon]